MKIISLAITIFILGVSSMLSSCVTFSSSLSTDAKPVQGSAYLYGRFLLNHSSYGRLRMGLAVQSAGKKPDRHTLQFESKDPLVMIPVIPGKYSLKELVFASANYEAEGRKALPEGELTKSFVAEAGKAYYIADMVGESSTGSRVHSWRLTSVKDNFDATTADIRKKYSNFQQLEYKRALE